MKWYGNRGVFTPDPGTVESAQCDVCREPMTVERNVEGATQLAEAMAGRKHLHDFFRCPNLKEAWHTRAVDLICEATNTKSTTIRKLLADEIATIIATKKIPD